MISSSGINSEISIGRDPSQKRIIRFRSGSINTCQSPPALFPFNKFRGGKKKKKFRNIYISWKNCIKWKRTDKKKKIQSASLVIIVVWFHATTTIVATNTRNNKAEENIFMLRSLSPIQKGKEKSGEANSVIRRIIHFDVDANVGLFTLFFFFFFFYILLREKRKKNNITPTN